MLSSILLVLVFLAIGAATISCWLSRCASGLSFRVSYWFAGYAEHIWRHRVDIFDACRDFSDFYSALKRHAFLHGLAATQARVFSVVVSWVFWAGAPLR